MSEVQNANHEPELPKVICPVIRAMVHEEQLRLNEDNQASISQLKVLTDRLGMPWYSFFPAYIANRFFNMPGNIIFHRFNPTTMEKGMIKHPCGSMVLSSGQPGVFDEARFQALVQFSREGRMTKEDFDRARAHFRQRDESHRFAWLGAIVNKIEFSILLGFLGKNAADGERYISVENMRKLYERAEIPSHSPVPHKSKTRAVIRGQLMLQSGTEKSLPGLQVELWQKRLLRKDLLLDTYKQTTRFGRFTLTAMLPKDGLPLYLRIIDPRATMTRDRDVFEIECPGRVSGNLNLGKLRVPHWQYDRSFPFPVARKNDYTERVPQRFTKRMDSTFLKKGFRWMIVAKTLVSTFPSWFGLSGARDAFKFSSAIKVHQDQDSDAYFMYRILNGFYPSPVYDIHDNPPFSGAKYFVDCDYDAYQSDGVHNLISGRLYFTVEPGDNDPTPIGIHLRIRDAASVAPGSTNVQEVFATPMDNNWREAKRAFRSCWGITGELDAHLCTGHLNVGQYAIAAYRNFYSSPVADLMLPVLRGVTDINERGKSAIFGVSGVLSTNSPLTTGALWAKLISHLGTRDWHNWQPRQPLYEGHRFAKAANLYWDQVSALVEEFFSSHQDNINEHWQEVEAFSNDLFENCVTFYQENDFTPANGDWRSTPQIDENGNLLSINLSMFQIQSRSFKSQGHLSAERAAHGEQAPRQPALHKVRTYDDLKHCCKYVMFHSTFWHWWSNDLQETDMSNIHYTSLGLRGGAMGSGEDVMPPVREAAGQLAFAKLLTSVQVGKVVDPEGGDVLADLADRLRAVSGAFASIGEFPAGQQGFELDRTFDVNNIRSRINI